VEDKNLTYNKKTEVLSRDKNLVTNGWGGGKFDK
jgi:hypothetical protein